MLSDFRPLLSNNRFIYLWISQILSQLTINVVNFLLLIRIYSQTGSTIATSLLFISYAIPAIIIGPIAAAATDIFEKRKMLMISNLLQASTIFFYAISHKTGLFLLFGVAMMYSFFNQFYVPAEYASLPNIVAKKKLAQANGLFFMTQTASLIVGFSLAGILNQILGFTTTLYVCSTFLFAAFVSVSFLSPMKQGVTIPKKFEHALVTFFERIMEGYRFISQNTKIRYPFLLLILLQISIAVIVVNIPVYAEVILRIPIELSGHVLAIPVGLGAGIAGLTIPRILENGWRKKRVIELSLAILAASLFFTVFVITSITTGARLIFGVATIFALGFSFVGVLIPAQTYLQEKTPGGLRGRVFGNYWFLVTIATIFPVIFSGVITDILGIPFLLFSLGLLAFFVLVLSLRYGQKAIEESF